MELWIDSWIYYLLDIWHNATTSDYLALLLCVIVVGGLFNVHRSNLK
ncbi:hypothetical protein Enr17x_06000 [Gimesia fumaroli]|uniref:Uncharacterized protein n=1 Tax=Gimesia fumaroli TaxID=2527976 RepID=A0A518I659_9PLAN|nr:hypothetical protein Enr17x_06000 [Gimesia fumaroli]